MNGSALEEEDFPEIRHRLRVVIPGSYSHLVGARISVQVECAGRTLLEVLTAYSRCKSSEAILVGTLVREDVAHDPLVLEPSVSHTHHVVDVAIGYSDLCALHF